MLVTIEIIIQNYSFNRGYQVTKFTFKPFYGVNFLNAYEERRKRRMRNFIIKNDQKLDWQFCVCGVYLFCFPRVEVKTLEKGWTRQGKGRAMMERMGEIYKTSVVITKHICFFHRNRCEGFKFVFCCPNYYYTECETSSM